jgi:uncharacterized repeat protein (TIGR01451 family)
MNSLWHPIDGSSLSCVGFRSPTHCYYFGIDSQCNYDNGLIKDGTMTSPVITLTGAGDTNLSFWTKWQVESMDPACYDQLWVERASGTSWVKFAAIGPTSDPPSSAPSVGMASITGLGGQPQWEFVQLDLSAFAPGPIQLRFRFLSGACLAAGCGGSACGPPDADFDNFLGWAIDDISFGCPPGELTLQKSASPSFASRGQNITYTLSAKNWDPGTQNLSVWDILPAGADFVSASPAYSLSSGVVSWSLPGLSSGASQAMTLVVQVDPATPYPTDWMNTAEGSSSAGGAPFISQVAPVKIRLPGLQLTKSASPSTATSGDQVTFTITVSNFNSSTISEVDLNETLPTGFVQLGAYQPFTAFNTWKVMNLLPGETRVFSLWGFANGFNGQVITNKVEAFIGGISQGVATASVLLQRPDVPQLTLRAVYPNPAPSGKAGLPQDVFIWFETNQAMDMNMQVYNVAGEKVRAMSFRANRGTNQADWDLKNDYGANVASGIYLARLWSSSDLGTVEIWAHIAVLR